MLLSLVLAAFAQDPEPVVGRVSRVHEMSVPQVSCQSGVSGAATVSELIERALSIYRVFAGRSHWSREPQQCGGNMVTISPNGVCVDDDGVKVCVNTSGKPSIDDPQCTLGGRENALRALVTTLETCPGITPLPVEGRPSRNN